MTRIPLTPVGREAPACAPGATAGSPGGSAKAGVAPPPPPSTGHLLLNGIFSENPVFRPRLRASARRSR